MGFRFWILYLLWVSVFSCTENTNTCDKEIVSRFSDSSQNIKWSSEKWAAPDCIEITGEAAQSDNKLSVLSFWNTDSLYFFFKVEDKDLRACQDSIDHPKLFLDDMVEVLLDTKNNKDSCWAEDDIVYHVNLNKVKKDDRGTEDCISNPKWNGNAGISLQLLGTLDDTTDIDQGYLMGIVFPWEEIGQSPKSNLMMSVNFANGDNDGKGRQLYDWVGTWPMRSPYAFGKLILKK